MNYTLDDLRVKFPEHTFEASEPYLDPATFDKPQVLIIDGVRSILLWHNWEDLLAKAPLYFGIDVRDELFNVVCEEVAMYFLRQEGKTVDEAWDIVHNNEFK